MSEASLSLTSPVQGSIVPNLGKPSNPITTVQNIGSSSGSPVSSSNGGKPPAQVASVVSGVTSSTRHAFVVGQSAVVVPPTKTKAVTPPSSTGKPSRVQSIFNQISWRYTHLRNIPFVSNVNFQPMST